MNEKLKIFGVTFSVAAVFSAASFAAGKEMTQRKMQSSPYAESGEQQVALQSTDIAIANQDSGVNYNGEDMNYAADFLQSVDNDFILTNREAAKKGIRRWKIWSHGSYSGKFF